MNKVIILGNLTRDIELKHTQSGSAIASTGIATTRKFKTQSGEQREEVLFVDLTFFGRSAEIANQYLHKGSKILVDGRLKLDSWTAQDGTKRSKHGITVESMQMLDSKPQGQPQQPQQQYQQPQAQQQYQQPQAQPMQQQQAQPMPAIDVSDDDIPFAPIGMSEGGYYVHLI